MLKYLHIISDCMIYQIALFHSTAHIRLDGMIRIADMLPRRSIIKLIFSCLEYRKYSRNGLAHGLYYFCFFISKERGRLMVRGNVCTAGECEGVFFLDTSYLSQYRKVIKGGCGHVAGFDMSIEPMTAKELLEAGIRYNFYGSHADWIYDENGSSVLREQMISYVTECFLRRFRAFRKVSMWRGSLHIVMQSKLFEVAVVYGDWCVAWCLLERKVIDGAGSYRAFMRLNYQAYLNFIKQILLDGWGEAIGFSGAWMSGKRHTIEDIVA